MSLENKVTVITGGSRGIGESIVRTFLKKGAKVVFTNPNAQNGAVMMKTLEKEGLAKNARYFKADISVEAEVQALVAFVTGNFGDCEVLCNNAAIFVGGTVHETSIEDWNRLFAVNVTGLYLCCKHFLPAMLRNKKGSIVNTSSISGMLGEYNMAAYCATKGAVGNLTRAMALDYADSGIRVNAVCPGATKTPMFMTGTSPALMKRFEAVFPPRRIGLPEEVAEAIAFLASDSASFINGVMLPVDGGISAHSGQPRQDKSAG